MDKRIKFYSQNTNLLPPRPKSSLRHLKQGIQKFHRTVILEKIVQFQYPKSWKMNLLGLQIKHVILTICNILTSDTKFYPHHFNIIRVTGC